MGECLSWEIREAFRQPVNRLSQLRADEDFDREEIEISDQSLQEPFNKRTPVRKDFDREEIEISDQSLQEQFNKRKPIKKPKRKKTPHVSQEQLPPSEGQESEPEEDQKQLPPRPKRKSKKKKPDVPPYQETISIKNEGFKQMYENQRMVGIEQPDILVSDPYERQSFQYADEEPEAPPRRNKSLKSLTSEHDSISDEIKYANQGVPQQDVEAYRMEHEYIIPTAEEPPPIKPARTRSRTRSQSRTTQGEDELQEPCEEEPCVQQVCDYMGYAIIDKSKQRDPPLPPPTRKKRSKDSCKFFTVPRPLKEEVPVRPLRNYSTLVPKERWSTTNITDEEKENIGINLNQYIEIDDGDHAKVLQSGDVIQKMKDRPLPAPPRPPRKLKPILTDVTHVENNIESEAEAKLEESEASVQTEPLPDDFVCEEFIQEKTDKVITPSKTKPKQPVNEFEHQETITHGALVVAPVPATYQEGPLTSFSRSTERIITVKRETNPAETSATDAPIQLLKTEKIQMADLDVNRLTVNELLASKIKVSEIEGGNITVSEINPKSGGNIVLSGVELPAHLLQELIQRIQSAQASNEGIGEVPPPQELPTTEGKQQPQPIFLAEESTIKDIESQIITDDIPPLEIERKKNQMLNEDIPSATEATEIKVGEDIPTLGGINFETEIAMEDIPPPLEKIEADERIVTPEDEDERLIIEELQQKKTSFDLDEPPQRPPRHSDFQRLEYSDSSEAACRSETPPPRPPEPEDILETIYLRSQPPPAFYNLRSPVFHEIIDDIPLPPRRKRQQKTLSESRSSSEEAPPTTRSRRTRTPEPSIPELAGQLVRACTTASDKALKRLIKHITTCVLQNADGRQDLHVMVVILLVLIAGLILLGWGDGKTVHYHHWEYFNPPRDL